jgi:hypothetical protein
MCATSHQKPTNSVYDVHQVQLSMPLVHDTRPPHQNRMFYSTVLVAKEYTLVHMQDWSSGLQAAEPNNTAKLRPVYVVRVHTSAAHHTASTSLYRANACC